MHSCEITPSPRPSGERAGGEGIWVQIFFGLLFPAFSSSKEEKENTRNAFTCVR
jgi:hypothetical protein